MKLPADLRARVEAALDAPIAELRPLSGGCVGEVYGLRAGGSDWVLKIADGRDAGLAVEGRMLAWLAEHTRLPGPRPVSCDARHLLMNRLAGGGGLTRQAEIDASDALAELHGLRAERYGFDFDTVIGGLPQANGWLADWADFFGQRRLIDMARQAHAAGNLPGRLRDRVEKLAARLPGILGPANPPGLIHGDVWSGNVLVADGRLSGFIDPAIHYADPEIELAFITLFSTFGDAFFARYREHRPLSADFWEFRRPLYNLYPLLVHARLFGGHYVSSVAATLDRYT